jgi:hypothetical protein
MFIGHIGVALAGKRVAPRTSLGSLVAAAQLLDLLWPVFLLAGIEHVRIALGITRVVPFDFYDYPISHSLVMAALWGAVFASIYWLRSRDAQAALVMGALVVSHWVLDFASHRPDMPLLPVGGPKLGLGMWNSWAATLTIEPAIYIAGVVLYARATRARDGIGRWAFWSLIVFLAVMWTASLVAPPPPSVRAVAIGSLSVYLFVWWAWWADRHRETNLK